MAIKEKYLHNNIPLRKKRVSRVHLNKCQKCILQFDTDCYKTDEQGNMLFDCYGGINRDSSYIFVRK